MVWLPGWTPDAGSSGFQGGLRSPGYPPRSPPAKLLLLRCYLRVLGWTPEGVDSQKNGSDASDMPRCAPQHTFSARKEPEISCLAVCLSPVRSPVAPKKLSPPSHPVNRLSLAFRPVWTPIWIPVRTLGSPTASISKPIALAIFCTRLSRAYPIHTSGAGFCPFEKCPPNTFLSCAIPYAAPASLITSCRDRLRLNRRLLRRSEMTDSP